MGDFVRLKEILNMRNVKDLAEEIGGEEFKNLLFCGLNTDLNVLTIMEYLKEFSMFTPQLRYEVADISSGNTYRFIFIEDAIDKFNELEDE